MQRAMLSNSDDLTAIEICVEVSRILKSDPEQLGLLEFITGVSKLVDLDTDMPGLFLRGHSTASPENSATFR